MSFFSLHNIGAIAPLEGITGIINAYDTVNLKKSSIITAVGIENLSGIQRSALSLLSQLLLLMTVVTLPPSVHAL